MKKLDSSSDTLSNSEPDERQVQELVRLYEQGFFRETIKKGTQIAKSIPKNMLIFNILGAAHAQLHNYDSAVAYFELILEMKPDDGNSYYNIGVAMQDKGDLRSAIKNYRKAITCNPNHATTYYNLGNAFQEVGNLESAIENYAKAIKLKPDYAEAWNNIVFPMQAIKPNFSSVGEILSLFLEQSESQKYKGAKSILKYRLCQGGKGAEGALKEALSLLSHFKYNNIKNPRPSNENFEIKTIMPQKIVALLNFGRSGTGLLHSLFDGHPEVSTLPSIYLSEFFDHSTWEKIIAGDWSEIVERFISIYEVLFDASAPNAIATAGNQSISFLGRKEGMTNVGEYRNEVIKIDKKRFHTELNRLVSNHNQLDAYAFLQLVHASYNVSLDDNNKKTLIFYHIHNPDTYAQLNLLQSAPHTDWLVMIREPIQSCESWIRKEFQNNDYLGITTRVVKMLFEVDNIVFQKNNSIGVRLEDLKEYPEKTINAICDWAGIRAHENLYKMTAQGKKWWGDPTSPDFLIDGMDPFGKTSIRREVGLVFSENDQFILRTLFYPFSVRFKYVEANLNKFKADLQAIRPMMNNMFDFENRIVQETQADPEQFVRTGTYLYLRSVLLERWTMLNTLHTYPNMLKPLVIS